MRAVCLKHVPFEGPGAFATVLIDRGVRLEHYLVLRTVDRKTSAICRLRWADRCRQGIRWLRC